MVTRGWWAALVVLAGCEPAPDEPDAKNTDDVPTSPSTVPTADLLHGVAIAPPSLPIHTRSELTCHPTLKVPRDQVADLTYRWTNATQGTSLGDERHLTLTPQRVQPGDQIHCRVRVVDLDGSYDEAAATRAVEDPQLDLVNAWIQPHPPELARAHTCGIAVNHSHDLTTSTSTTWRNLTRGTTLTTRDTWTASPDDAAVGDEIGCDIAVVDAAGLTLTHTVTATIAERRPHLGPITVLPANPQVGDTVTCDATATHPDGLPVDLTVTWHNLTRPYEVTTPGLSLTLDPAHFEIGHQVRCTITARGVDTQTQRAHIFGVDIENNRPPVVTAVRIDPPGPVVVTEPLVCSADAVDPDGTEPVLSYHWTNPARSGWSHDGAVLPPERLVARPGDQVRCTVTATDGTLSDTGSADVEVLRVPPVLLATRIAPRPVVSPDAVLECVALAVSPSRYLLSYTHTWRNLTTDEPLGEGLRLDLASIPDVHDGDVIGCEVEVSEHFGDLLGTASVVVDATSPLGEVDTSPILGTLRHIPGGTYVRGCDPARADFLPPSIGHLPGSSVGTSPPSDTPCDPTQRPSAVWDTPAHPVTLTRDLWVSERHVDVLTVLESGTSLSQIPYVSPLPGYPVKVSWAEALMFANEVSIEEGLPPCYDLQHCSGFNPANHGVQAMTCSSVDVLSPSGSVLDCEGWRLPTDAETEYLMRAGEAMDPDDPAPIVRESRGNLAFMPPDYTECLIGPSAFGLCDGLMAFHGLWVWDRRDTYPDPPPSGGLIDPVGDPDPAEPASRRPIAPFLRWAHAAGGMRGFMLVRTAE